VAAIELQPQQQRVVVVGGSSSSSRIYKRNGMKIFMFIDEVIYYSANVGKNYTSFCETNKFAALSHSLTCFRRKKIDNKGEIDSPITFLLF